MLKVISSIACTICLLTAQTSRAQNVMDKDTAMAITTDSVAPAFVLDTVPAAKEVAKNARTPIQSKPLSLRSIVIPSAMIAYGTFALTNEDLKRFNLAVRKELWDENAHKKFPLDNFSLVAPAIAVYGLNIAGIKGKNNFVDRTALYALSNLIGSGIVTASKRVSREIRPDSSNTLSFPSGHSAQAFIAAEFMRQEYKDVSPWYGVAAYTVAAGTGFLRMYNNKHWFNDVIAGAGVGILSTRLSYWLYPKIKNAVFKEKKTSTMFMPTYQNGAVGFGLVHTF